MTVGTISAVGGSGNPLGMTGNNRTRPMTSSFVSSLRSSTGFAGPFHVSPEVEIIIIIIIIIISV